MSDPPSDHRADPGTDDLIAAMRTASGPRLAELGRQLADLLEGRKAVRDKEIDGLRHAARRLERAVADLVAATSGTELLRRACGALADICSAERVLAAGIDSGTAICVASSPSEPEDAIPASYRLDPESAEFRVAASGGSRVVTRPAPELNHLFPQGSTVMAVSVDETPVAIVHIAGELLAAQYDSAALVLEVAGSCLRRLSLSARRTRQLDLLRSTGIAREGRIEPAPAAEDGADPAPPAPTWMEPLTERESEVLRLVLRGASNTAVAAELVITVDTVKSHVKHILRKLGATNRSELIARHSAGLTRRSIPPPSR